MRFSKSAIVVSAIGAALAFFASPAPDTSSSHISFAASAAARTPCGGEGQRACIAIVDGGPIGCRKGLVERSKNVLDPTAGYCVRPPKNSSKSILNKAEAAARQSAPLLAKAASIWARCPFPGNVLSNPHSTDFHDSILASNCYEETMQLADEAGYDTVTIGFVSGGGIIIGADFEKGYAFDVAGQLPASRYRTKAFEMGTFGGGAGIVVGFYKDKNQPGSGGIAGKAHGASGAFGKGLSKDVGVWYDYNGRYLGITVAVTKGLGIEAAYVRNETEVWRTNLTGSVIVPAQENAPPREEQPAYVYRPVQTQPGSLAQYEYADQQTEVQFCNRTREPVHVAFGYYDWGKYSPRSNWSSVGWWTLDGGRCAWVGLPDQADGSAYFGEIFVVGRSSEERWQARSGMELCAPSGDAFHFGNTEAIECHTRDVMIGQRYVVGPHTDNTIPFE